VVNWQLRPHFDDPRGCQPGTGSTPAIGISLDHRNYHLRDPFRPRTSGVRSLARPPL
jgi:hypothetical protein